MLLDENFVIPCQPYYEEDHKHYLASLTEADLNRKMEQFVQGSGGGYFCSNPNYQRQGTTTTSIPQEVYVVPGAANVSSEALPSTTTTRPELAGRSWTFHSYVPSLPASKKLKSTDSAGSSLDSGVDEPWKRQSVAFLEECKAACNILLQCEQHLQDSSVLMAKQPHMTHVEDVLLTIAAYPDCTDGTFYMCSYEINHNEQPIVYTRYFESGTHKGFFQQHSVEMLNLTQDAVSWQVYNEADIHTCSKAKQEKTCTKMSMKKDKRSHRPDRTYESNVSSNPRSLQKTIPKLIQQITAAPGIALKCLIVYCSPCGQEPTQLTRKLKRQP